MYTHMHAGNNAHMLQQCSFSNIQKFPCFTALKKRLKLSKMPVHPNPQDGDAGGSKHQEFEASLDYTLGPYLNGKKKVGRDRFA